MAQRPIATTADGQQAVIDSDGELIGVSVLASSQGMSLVQGLDAGVLVRALALLPQQP